MSKILELLGKNPLDIEKEKPVLKCVGDIFTEIKRANYIGIEDCREVQFAFNGDKVVIMVVSDWEHVKEHVLLMQ